MKRFAIYDEKPTLCTLKENWRIVEIIEEVETPQEALSQYIQNIKDNVGYCDDFEFWAIEYKTKYKKSDLASIVGIRLCSEIYWTEEPI